MTRSFDILETSDGSYTLISSTFGEPYHSRHGAITESEHVFINAGLLAVAENKKKISVFEMGFGTGLNALLTWMKAEELELKCNYHAVEPYPLQREEWASLNYGQLLDQEKFERLHACKWNQEVKLSEHFSFKKISEDIEEYLHLSASPCLEGRRRNQDRFDLLYYDAFAPNAQPELWTESIFSQMFSLLNTGGILVTYCAKGQVKRNMKAAGFIVESLPGPPRKREMIRATKVKL